jgi:hypothetical protein
MQFALILLLLFATGCWLTELVDAKKKKKKKKKRTPSLDNNETCANNTDNKGFNDAKASANANFSFDSDNDYNSAIANLSFKNKDDSSNNNVAISDD